MKNLVCLFILSVGITLCVVSCGNKNYDNQESETLINTETSMGKTKFNNASPDQLAGIQKALDAYIQAAVKGDSKIAEPVFTDNATISHIENDSLISLPIQALFDYYNSDVCPQPASYEITVCNVSEDVAIVEIDSDFGGTKFDDMFTMVKDGKDWKIASKVFHVK